MVKCVLTNGVGSIKKIVHIVLPIQDSSFYGSSDILQDQMKTALFNSLSYYDNLNDKIDNFKTIGISCLKNHILPLFLAIKEYHFNRNNFDITTIKIYHEDLNILKNIIDYFLNNYKLFHKPGK